MEANKTLSSSFSVDLLKTCQRLACSIAQWGHDKKTNQVQLFLKMNINKVHKKLYYVRVLLRLLCLSCEMEMLCWWGRWRWRMTPGKFFCGGGEVFFCSWQSSFGPALSKNFITCYRGWVYEMATIEVQSVGSWVQFPQCVMFFSPQHHIMFI